MYKALNERSYWLIEMNIKKTLSTIIAFPLALNLVDKAVVHFLLIMLDSCKERSSKQQATFTAEHF